MSPSHPDEGSLRGFARLGPDERATLLEHARSCNGCRARLLEDDPTRVFAFLSADSVPREALERLTASVGAELDRSSARARRPATGFAWGAVAASFLLAALIGVYLGSQPVVAPVASMASLGGVPAATAGIELDQRAIGFEILSPTDAQVYDLSVGETQIVMIFDEGLDI